MQRTFVSDLKIMNVFVVRLRRWRFLRGASDDMYVGQRSLQVQKQMDTFF